jgi:hypothetical protein
MPRTLTFWAQQQEGAARGGDDALVASIELESALHDGSQLRTRPGAATGAAQPGGGRAAAAAAEAADAVLRRHSTDPLGLEDAPPSGSVTVRPFPRDAGNLS